MGRSLFAYGRVARTPPKKCLICDILLFFHMFFAISFRVRSNTYSKVMILYPKGNSMLLNTFLTLFWWWNYFFVLSATKKQNCLNRVIQSFYQRSRFCAKKTSGSKKIFFRKKRLARKSFWFLKLARGTGAERKRYAGVERRCPAPTFENKTFFERDFFF